MKSITIQLTGCLLSIILIAAACNSKNLLDENKKWNFIDSSQLANIRVIQCFAGNTPQIPTAPNLTTGPQVFLYANGSKLNGIALSYGGQWPIPNVYATVPSGNVRFEIIQARMNLSVVPNIPAPIAGDTLLSFSQNLQQGKYYSFFIGDTVPSLRVVVNEDKLDLPDYQTYKIRVANWIMNPSDTLTLFSRRQNAEIISAVPHKNVSNWVQVPLPVINDTLELRRKGSATTYITVGGTAPSFFPTGLRMYTVTVRGKTGVAGKAISASIVTNR